MAYDKLILLCFCVCTLFSYTHTFIVLDGAPRKVTKILTVTNGAPWGSWADPSFCADGSYAIGYSLKVEKDLGQIGDDTAVNAIRLNCASLDHYYDDITSGQELLGEWHTNAKCQEGSFFVAFALQVESDQHSGDETAVNDVRFQCREFSARGYGVQLETPPGHAKWGTWGNNSGVCDPDAAICGIQTRIMANQKWGDDTSLNDARLYCCVV